MSCPSDLEPYAKAYQLEVERRDSEMHMAGMYSKIAFETVMAHFGAGLAGKKSSAEYIKEPFLQMAKSSRPLTEEEKQREVDLFFARENARRFNWKRNKGKVKDDGI